jgi:hypothetical protein
MISLIKGWSTFIRHHSNYKNRMNLIHRIPNPKIREALESLFTEGFYKIPNYWERDKVLYWEARLDERCINTNADEHLRFAGQRWHDIHIDFPDIVSDYGMNGFLQQVAKSYIGVDNYRKIVYQHSFPRVGFGEEQIKVAIKDGSYEKNIGLGQYWHFDSWDHGLKAVLYLSDVNLKNGPFSAIPGSHRLNLKTEESRLKIRKCAGVLPPHEFDSSKLYYSSEDEEMFSLKSRSMYATGKRGDLYLIDPLLTHRAEIPLDGVRKVLWIYYW